MKTLQRILLFCLMALPLVAFSAGTVDINTADSELLVDELVGVGPQKALAIVRYRQQHGPFKRVEDLALVNGIGPRTVEQNRGRMTVSQPKAKAAAKKKP